MTLPRIFLVVTFLLFGGIALAAYMKRPEQATKIETAVPANVPTTDQPIQIDLAALNSSGNSVEKKAEVVQKEAPVALPAAPVATPVVEVLPEANQIHLLFQKNSPLPFVETIQYKARVPWKSGRAAWLVDYASHYKTPLHFIARSLNNGQPNYTPPAVKDGATFNILSQEKEFYFHLLVDISRCKMWFYAVLPESAQRTLLKTYQVGLGRKDPQKQSGYLTPTGKYVLGNRIAIYQPKMMGNHKGKRVELIQVFGTRWIPFEKELGPCSEPAKGFGIHGTPWQFDEQKGTLADNTSSLGKYESDGCIRMKTSDVEELYAIISTHRTLVEIVPQFKNSTLN